MRVTITSHFEGQEPETIHARGALQSRGEQFLLTYDEPSDDGMQKITVKLSPDKAVILRPNARMVIEKGISNLCAYGTVAGVLDFEFIGKRVNYELNEHGGKIELEYKIENRGQSVADARIFIELKE